MESAKIAAVLPHRYPFLFVDRVIEVEEDRRIVGIKNVTVNEPFFAGHFPGQPIMPGVLICEAVIQAGGILAYHSPDGINQGKTPILTGLDRVRFRRQVVPRRSTPSRVRGSAAARTLLEDAGQGVGGGTGCSRAGVYGCRG